MKTGRRILCDMSDLMSFMPDNTHPTGIQRVAIDAFQSMRVLSDDVMPVFYSPVRRALCRLDADRLLGRDLDYLARINPRRRRLWNRLRAHHALRGSVVDLRPGDTLLILGANSQRRDRALFQNRPPGLRVIWFCHDLIPLKYPEFSFNTPQDDEAYGVWMRNALGHGDDILCSSRFVANDVADYAREQGLSARLSVVTLAHEFRAVDAGYLRDAVIRLRREQTVLYVSTIGPRKNHKALVELWRRLGSEMGDALPVLVLVGQAKDRGELADHLLSAPDIAGKIVHLEQVSDAELTDLYRHCAFTVFPSLFEGWGLPVGESLWMGKPCVSSSATSLPEVGGDHVVYVDPSNWGEFDAALRLAIAGRFAAMPPPRQRLRMWRHVCEDIMRIVAAPAPAAGFGGGKQGNEP